MKLKLLPAFAVAMVAASLLLACKDNQTPQANDAQNSEEAQSETAKSDAPKKSYQWKLASYQPPGAAEAVATKRWAEEVAAATDGRVKIQFFFQEGLVPGAEILQAVGDGRADLGYIADAYYPGELPLTSVAGVPFVAGNPEAQGKAFIDLYKNNETYRDEWAKQNTHVLIWAPVPSNAMAVKTPVTSLDDLKGQKIRVIGYSSQVFKGYGITPVAISQSEVYEALQRGVINGTTSSFDILIDRSYQEIAPHFVDPKTGSYAVTMNIINKKLWDGLPDDLKEAIESVNEKYLAMYMEELQKHEDEACEKLKSSGGDIVRLADDEVESWAAATKQDAIDAWADSVNKSNSNVDAEAFLADYTKAIEDAEQDSSYVSIMERCVIE